MKRKSITKAIAFSILAFGLWSCEQDFTEMGSEIIDNDQFGFDKYVVEHVSAVNHESGIANTRNLPTNSLGVYTHNSFGKTTAHIITQIEMGTQTALSSRSEEHTSELQSRPHLVCRLLLEKKKKKKTKNTLHN